ncbi:cytosolic phospholipase A2 gamma-like [Pelobates fuscus]|uniref:cytosolic phospholipase A2 gamma-like n=1 Tax=Pelobates fuscus TaxID=191477 RepID=UPI002FE43672
MDISTGENTSVKNRREKVHEAFKRLKINTEGDVPVVAVLGSGGGLRAMIGFLGVLSELANDDILDTVTYICGTSGSTWCMSSLYDNDNWSNCIGEMEGKICKTFEKEYDLQKSWEKLKQTKENDTASLTSFWAHVIIQMMTKDVNEKKLSDYCGACEIGSNPYPVYAAVEKTNVNNGIKHEPETWFEFTPHTSGFPAYKEYVDTKLLGSKFEQGKVSKSQPEREVCFLQGIWGSALGSEKVIFDFIKEQIREIWSKLWSILAQSNKVTSHGEYCKCALLKELLAEDLESLDYKQSEEFLQKLKHLLEDVEKREKQLETKSLLGMYSVKLFDAP